MLCNRVVDVAVAIAGWWIVVIICICSYVPWISSKNAYGEWIKDHPGYAGYAGYQQSDASDGTEDDEEEQEA